MTWVLLLAAVAPCGCTRLRPKQAAKYQTVSASGSRDTEVAKQEHAAALAHLEGGVNLAKAEQLLNDALVADVTYGPAHNSLGTLYFMQGKLYLAAWEFEYAAKLMPDLPQPYNNLGLVYERAGKYDEAISYYSMALSREPNNPEMVGNLVRTRMLTGDRSPDLRHMLSDLALNHTNPYWQNWARDQVELTKFDEQLASLPEDWRIPDKAPEQLPLPVRQEDVLPNELPKLLPQIPEGRVPQLAEPQK